MYRVKVKRILKSPYSASDFGLQLYCVTQCCDIHTDSSLHHSNQYLTSLKREAIFFYSPGFYSPALQDGRILFFLNLLQRRSDRALQRFFAPCVNHLELDYIRSMDNVQEKS